MSGSRTSRLTLTQRELEIVRRDWAKVEAMGEAAGTLLYERLFALDPSVRELFPEDMGEQKKALMRIIGAAVHGLSDPEILMPIVEHLGRKHVRLGVRNHHYATVGAALLWTLKRALGEEMNAEHEAAWSNAYALLAEAMKAPA